LLWGFNNNNTKDSMHTQTDQTKPLVTYTPKKKGRKWATDVTSGGGNGGLYRQGEFKKAVEMMTTCAHTLPNARLFHVCLTGGCVAAYQLVIKRLCRALKAHDVVTRYRAGIEHDQTKGEHCHLFIVLSSPDQQTARFITAADESKKRMANDSTLLKVIQHTRTECPTLKHRVMVPKHPNCNPSPDGSPPKPVAFLQFNQTNQAFFDNAVEWLSYAYKRRSKEGIAACYLSDKQNKVPTVRQMRLCEIAS
jgi:tRNA/tmRNA/rRNA uracil-C5-methylase (TrmA/RlmC/RlmD family)